MASCEAVAVAQRSSCVRAALGLTVYLLASSSGGGGSASVSGGGAPGGGGMGPEARAQAKALLESLLEVGGEGRGGEGLGAVSVGKVMWGWDASHRCSGGRGGGGHRVRAQHGAERPRLYTYVRPRHVSGFTAELLRNIMHCASAWLLVGKGTDGGLVRGGWHDGGTMCGCSMLRAAPQGALPAAQSVLSPGHSANADGHTDSLAAAPTCPHCPCPNPPCPPSLPALPPCSTACRRPPTWHTLSDTAAQPEGAPSRDAGHRWGLGGGGCGTCWGRSVAAHDIVRPETGCCVCVWRCVQLASSTRLGPK